MQDIFADLDDGSFDNVKTNQSLQQKFPCPECAGSGRYQGARVHQQKAHCFACRGKGYFLTDPRKLRANRAKRAQKKLDDYAAFADANADVIREISAAAEWSDFASSLSNQLAERKPWTENQLAAAQRMAAKLVAKREARQAEDRKGEVAVDLSPIRAMFDAAQGSGYKRPAYRAEGLKLTLAPAHGRNAGALYVVRLEDDAYLGKIEGATFKPTRDGRDAAPALHAIAADPKGSAVRYGQRTGTCSCCGRELTNHASIELGIGPICAQKWGL